MAETAEIKSCLTEEKVYVKYVLNFKNTINDKTHPLYGGLSTRATIGITAPLINKRLPSLFTKEEIEFLSKDLNEDLSFNSKFWKEMQKDEYNMPSGIFPIHIGKEGLLLNKNNSIDYIKIKIIADSDIVATSPIEIAQNDGIRFVMTSEKDMFKKESISRKVEKDIVKAYEDIEDNIAVLRYVLRSFGKSVDSSHNLDFLQNEVWKLSKEKPTAFLVTVTDEHLDTKIKIASFINFKLINKSNNLYYTIDGVKLSLDGDMNDLNGTARYFDSGIGQELRLELEAKVKAIQTKK